MRGITPNLPGPSTLAGVCKPKPNHGITSQARLSGYMKILQFVAIEFELKRCFLAVSHAERFRLQECRRLFNGNTFLKAGTDPHPPDLISSGDAVEWCINQRLGFKRYKHIGMLVVIHSPKRLRHYPNDSEGDLI